MIKTILNSDNLKYSRKHKKTTYQVGYSLFRVEAIGQAFKDLFSRGLPQYRCLERFVQSCSRELPRRKRTSFREFLRRLSTWSGKLVIFPLDPIGMQSWVWGGAPHLLFILWTSYLPRNFLAIEILYIR